MTSVEKIPENSPNTLSEHEQSSGELGNTALKAVNSGTTPLLQPESVSNQEMDATMEKVQDFMYKMQDDPTFLAICEKRGIDTLDTTTSEYWNTFRDFADPRIEKMRERAPNNLTLDLLAVAASTPAHVYNQRRLDEIKPIIEKNGFKSLTPEQKTAYNAALPLVSAFNGKVRDFGKTWNPVAGNLRANLSRTILMSTEKHDRAVADQRIADSIRGAQHELGFSQILTAAGVNHRLTNEDDDLKGKDIIVAEPGYAELALDVKASLSQIEAKGGENLPFAKDRGTYKIYSLIQDKEFVDGRFRISDEAAAAKAASIPGLLAKMRAAV